MVSTDPNSKSRMASACLEHPQHSCRSWTPFCVSETHCSVISLARNQSIFPVPFNVPLAYGGGVCGALTGMFSNSLLGVYSAANGITHFVASTRLFGQIFHVSRTASTFSSSWKSAILPGASPALDPLPQAFARCCRIQNR